MPVFGPTDRFSDVAAMPGTDEAFATVVPFSERRSANSKATVARIEADGATTTTRLPAAGGRPGQRRPHRLPGAGRMLDGDLGRLALPLQRRRRRSRVDTEPAFQGTIEFRPNESAEQFIPDRRRSTTRSSSRRPNSSGTRPRKGAAGEGEAAAAAAAQGALAAPRAAPDRLLHGDPQGEGALLAKRGGRTVARTPRRTLGRGRHDADPAR